MHDKTLSHLKLLFVCSKNQWRSPTAEAIWRDVPGVSVRSGGTSSKARRRISESDLVWADHVLVMETSHRSKLQRQFPQAARDCEIHVLDIPDIYPFMDAELIDELKAAVLACLPDRAGLRQGSVRIDP